MAFKFDNNTILLLIALAILGYYIYSQQKSKEGLRQARGTSRSSKGISKKGQVQTQQEEPVVIAPVALPPPPPPVVKVIPVPVPVQKQEDDFAGLL